MSDFWLGVLVGGPIWIGGLLFLFFISVVIYAIRDILKHPYKYRRG